MTPLRLALPNKEWLGPITSFIGEKSPQLTIYKAI